MSVHLFVHYLDLVRHGLAYAWMWQNWVTNVTAGIVVFFVMSLFWPRLRHALEAFVKGHVKSIHDKLDVQHEERLRQAEVHQAATHELLKKHYQVQIDLAKAHHAFHVAAATPVKQTQPRNAKGHFVKKTS